ncbi:hypothetical protein DYH09_04115 [bacterium CPR1]|nr:hypothetical protein [bacterium CPR1]
MLELLRASNLPTVWTNVLVAMALSGQRNPLFFLALSFIYLGGMALNDCCDLSWDRRYRPDKPIPSGRVRLWQAALVAAFLLAGGATFLLMAGGRWATPLVALVVAYNLVHKRTGLAALLMGGCRGLILLCVTHELRPTLLVSALLLSGYVTLLTLLARREAFQQVRKGWLTTLQVAVTILTVMGMVLALYQLAFYALVLLLALFRARHFANRGNVKAMVLTLIAAISLLDACLLAAFGHSGWPGLVGFVLTRLWHRRVSGT